MFPSSLVGGHPRPRRPFTDPFSSPVPSWGDVPEADSEAVPMAPLRRLRSCFFDDGPRSEIREGDLAIMRRKYAIHPSVGMRSPTDVFRERGEVFLLRFQGTLRGKGLTFQDLEIRVRRLELGFIHQSL